MWFLFGLITTLGFVGHSLHTRLYGKWTGVRAHSVLAGSYEYRYVTHKGRTLNVTLGVDVAEGLDFIIKREGIFDKFFNWIGLSKEFQSGAKEFDAHVYIASDDIRLHELLASNESVREAILQLVTQKRLDCKFKTLRCRAGRLFVIFKTPGKFTRQQVSELADTAVPLLRTLSEAIANRQLYNQRWRDSFAYWAAGILAISTGLGINGIIQWVRLHWQTVPFMVDAKALVPVAFWMGGSVMFVLTMAALILLGRSARTHLVMAELILVGTFGAVSTSFAELRDANIEFDSSRASEYVVRTDGKRYKRHPRGPDEYFLRVKDWEGSGRSIEVEVPSELYRQVIVGDELRIFQRPGYLGYRWVERIERH